MVQQWISQSYPNFIQLLLDQAKNDPTRNIKRSFLTSGKTLILDRLQIPRTPRHVPDARPLSRPSRTKNTSTRGKVGKSKPNNARLLTRQKLDRARMPNWRYDVRPQMRVLRPTFAELHSSRNIFKKFDVNARMHLYDEKGRANLDLAGPRVRER